MFKTGGFMTDEKAAAAAEAFEAATQSLVYQKAMENVKKESLQSQPQGGSKSAPMFTLRDKDIDEEKQENEEWDDEAELRRIREAKLAHIKKQQSDMESNIAKGHGKYQEVAEEGFLPAVTGSKYVVCHFYHNDFERCRIVDKHLGILAPKHLPIRFIKINADKARFFVSKLSVRVLPTIVCFVDGIAVDRVVGFEELGGVDDFKTEVLEKRLEQAGVIATSESRKKIIKQQKKFDIGKKNSMYTDSDY